MQFLEFSPGFASKVFKFKDPDTGYEYCAPNRKALLAHIESYRLQNELATIENIHQVVDNYLCQLPDNCGACRAASFPRSFMGYLKGGIALIQNMYYGRDNLVSKEEADRRAGICIRCPNNVFPDKGPFIAWTDIMAEASTGGLKSKHYDELASCQVCNCPLRAKVWYGGKIVLSKEEQDSILKTMPECWQLKK
jgi:hypothetical protein